MFRDSFIKLSKGKKTLNEPFLHIFFLYNGDDWKNISKKNAEKIET